ncbi:proline iminopeptidase [Mycena belliarum]|uniref:Proline iminopeptidase n=1 Tax=Mycena belliarum TaxID=1033014 RepID=A0AAD6UDG2_9AGAR|nr:proline iminopeptidase [Mycena belliae]
MSTNKLSTTFPSEGTIPFTVAVEGAPTVVCQTWYKIIGPTDFFAPHTLPPLIGLHGGPGMAHDYLVPLADLSATRPVILYDQIGGGRSTHFSNKPAEFWSIDLFIRELQNLLEHFGLGSETGFYLLGHSWGGILATEFEVNYHPCGLKGIILSSSLASMELWVKSNRALLASFPERVQSAFANGFKAPKEYREALEEFYVHHACRITPQPKEVAAGGLDPIFGNRETGEGGDSTTSIAMNGGPLSGWTIIDRLPKVSVPCLIINGRYDMSQDYVVKPFFEHIAKVKWVTLENSSHLAMWEERERFIELVKDFMEPVPTS